MKIVVVIVVGFSSVFSDLTNDKNNGGRPTTILAYFYREGTAHGVLTPG